MPVVRQYRVRYRHASLGWSPYSDPVTANAVPVAGGTSYSLAEDGTLSVSAPGLLAFASDYDEDSLTAHLVSDVSNGSLTLNSNGSFTYSPSANFNGADSFTYRVYDGAVYSAPATVSLTITAVNDPPVGVDDPSYNVVQNNTLIVAAPGVLQNDTDVEGSPLTAVLVTDVSNGTLSLSSDGSFSYTPNVNFTGTDTFVYAPNDGVIDGGDATVTITVTEIPTTQSDRASSVTYRAGGLALLPPLADGDLTSQADRQHLSRRSYRNTLTEAVLYPPLLLEDFDTLRTGTTGADLWSIYLTEDPGQTGGYDAVNKNFSINTVEGEDLYVQCIPLNYNTDAGHLRYYIKSGTWNNAYNRLSYWMISDGTTPQLSQGNTGLMHFGTYTRTNGDVPTNQGQHFYHFFNPKITAGRYIKFFVNKHPQHQVGKTSTLNWGDNPTLNDPHEDQPELFDYFYGLTRVYVDCGNNTASFAAANYKLDDFYYSYDGSNADDLVASVALSHDGTGYNVSWYSLKNQSISFTVYVSDQSMKSGGLGVGTSIGTVSTPNNAYCDCKVNSGAMSEYDNGTYVAIVPGGDVGFSEYFLENRNN